MGILNKIYWSSVCALAGATAFLMLNDVACPKQGTKNCIELEQRIKSSQKARQKKVPVFKGYENPELQRYDNIIVEAVEFWNEFFKDEENYKEPPLGLIKRIMLIETAWGGAPVDEFYTDPMQVGKDFAYRVIAKTGGEGLFPIRGIPFLRKTLNPEISIYCGVGWIIHKAARYSHDPKTGRHIISIDYSRVPERYNGGGDPRYREKINSLIQKTP